MISEKSFPLCRFEYWVATFMCLCVATEQLIADNARSTDEFSITYFDDDLGLQQNSIRAIEVDAEGFVWLGTEKGLSRFDGRQFLNFSELNPDIPFDVVLGINVDSKNRVWTSWYGHTLRILSANRKDLLFIEPADGFPNDLIGRSEPLIFESISGDIWIPGIKFLYRLDSANRVTKFEINSPLNTNSGAVENANKIAFGSKHGLILIDKTSLEIESVEVPNSRLRKRILVVALGSLRMPMKNFCFAIQPGFLHLILFPVFFLDFLLTQLFRLLTVNNWAQI